jgi:hypothetical protein
MEIIIGFYIVFIVVIIVLEDACFLQMDKSFEKDLNFSERFKNWN